MSSIMLPGNAQQNQVLNPQTFSAGPNFNVVGTMPNNGAVTITPGTTNKSIAAGYHNGSGIVPGEPNLLASNIVSGASIFGVSGTGKRSASGSSGTMGSYSSTTVYGGNVSNISLASYTVTGLAFTPSRVIYIVPNSGYMSVVTNTVLYTSGANVCYGMVTLPNNFGFCTIASVGSGTFTLLINGGGGTWYAYE